MKFIGMICFLLILVACGANSSSNANNKSKDQLQRTAENLRELPEIATCFEKESQNRLIFPEVMSDSTAHFELSSKKSFQFKEAQIIIKTDSSSISIPIIDRSTLSPMSNWGSFDRYDRNSLTPAFQYGDCVVFFVNHPKICSSYSSYSPFTPILLNIAEGKAVNLGDKEFDQVHPRGVVFKDQKILIARGDVVGFSDNKTELFEFGDGVIPQDVWQASESPRVGSIFGLNGMLFVSHYVSVPGYSSDYTRLYKKDDFSTEIGIPVFKEKNRFMSGVLQDMQIDQNYNLGVFIGTFLYTHSGNVDGNVYYDFKFGILNRDGEFKPLHRKSPHGKVTIDKQNNGTFVLSWKNFDETIQVKIDDLGNLISQ